jgi:hypothetical protein
VLSQHRGNGEPGWPSSHDDGLGGHPRTLPVESALAAVCGWDSMGSNEAFYSEVVAAGRYRTSDVQEVSPMSQQNKLGEATRPAS